MRGCARYTQIDHMHAPPTFVLHIKGANSSTGRELLIVDACESDIQFLQNLRLGHNQIYYYYTDPASRPLNHASLWEADSEQPAAEEAENVAQQFEQQQ